MASTQSGIVSNKHHSIITISLLNLGATNMIKYIFLLFIASIGVAQATSAFDAKRLDYELRVGEWKSEYEVMSFFVLPNKKLKIVQGLGDDHKPVKSFEIQQEGKEIVVAAGEWEFTAPSTPGLVAVRITPENHKTALLNFFVLHPMSEVKKGKLNGYNIGEYPKEPYQSLDIYLPPKGFVEVTKENQDTFLSPHYQLKQFVSKQGGNYPRYVVLQTKLLRKLEFLTEVVNQKGIATNGFHIMSGYRTPFYNNVLKNKKWSRHQWGGASDIFIDENPVDGRMDDLNKDGKIDVRDSKYLASLVEEYYAKAIYKPFIGGLGIYKSNYAHGPFIHVDVRGFRARW